MTDKPDQLKEEIQTKVVPMLPGINGEIPRFVKFLAKFIESKVDEASKEAYLQGHQSADEFWKAREQHSILAERKRCVSEHRGGGEMNNKEKRSIEGYARALQDVMYKLTGDNSCAKSYDPCEIDSDTLHSYAFNLKDGGRHHPLSDYKNGEEIRSMMLEECIEWIKDKPTNQSN